MMMLGVDNHLANRDGRESGGLHAAPPPYMSGTGAIHPQGGPPGGMPPGHYHPGGGYGGFYPAPPMGAAATAPFPWNPGAMQGLQQGANTQGSQLQEQVNTVYESTPVSPPPQRERFSYTRYQLELMNGIFISIRYPNSMQKQLIAKRVGITRDQVKIWFQNRRRKDVVEKNNPKAKRCPPSGSDSDELDGVKMVPDGILHGMVSELFKYENDPKGKKAMKAQQQGESSGEGDRDGGSRKKRTVSGGVAGRKRKAEEALESDDMASKTDSGLSLRGSLNGDELMLTISPGYSPLSSTEQNTSMPSVASTSSSEAGTSPITAGNMPVPNVAASAAEVPTSAQLDMVAPPNVVAPVGYIPNFPRSNSEESLCQDDAVTDQSRTDADNSLTNTSQHSTDSNQDFVPPNKVAPPSAPIVPAARGSPTDLQPLSIHIPGAEKTGATNQLSSGFTPGQSQGLVGLGYWPGMPKPAVDYPQYARDNPYTAGFTPAIRIPASEQELMAATFSAHKTPDDGEKTPGPQNPQWSFPPPAQSGTASKPDCKVFPFPIVAEPAQFLPAMSNYANSYPSAGGPYLDPYQQPAVITSYNNPYYAYDAGMWQNNNQEKQRTASS